MAAGWQSMLHLLAQDVGTKLAHDMLLLLLLLLLSCPGHQSTYTCPPNML
jgi:hypothetical protein